jgi:hypothetical protein
MHETHIVVRLFRGAVENDQQETFALVLGVVEMSVRRPYASCAFRGSLDLIDN